MRTPSSIHNSDPVRGRVGWQFISILILAVSVWYLPAASEKLTPENVAPILPQLFKLHLSQHEMTPEFTKRLLKEYLTQLDPVHRFFLKSESDAVINKTDDELKKIGEHVMNADMSDFKAILEGYLSVQIARDADRYDGLAKREEEIKTEAARREAGKKVAEAANDKQVPQDPKTGKAPTPENPLNENPRQN